MQHKYNKSRKKKLYNGQEHQEDTHDSGDAYSSFPRRCASKRVGERARRQQQAAILMPNENNGNKLRLELNEMDVEDNWRHSFMVEFLFTHIQLLFFFFF